MRVSSCSMALGGTALLFALGACGGPKAGQDNAALASLDTRLTNGVGAANVAAPVEAAPVAAASNAVDTAETNSAHAATPPAPVQAATVSPSSGTATAHLAAVAGRPVGGCAGRGMRYGAQWAAAMPRGLGLYPGATLVEAAGTDTGRCALRAISFTTDDGPETVVAHYRATVRAAGYDAERQPCRTEIRLGGTRAADDAAYMLFARRSGGRTEVDIVATAG